MDTSTIILLAIVILAVAAGVWFYLQKQRSKQLRERFGPEYDRAMRSEGNAAHAEQVLQEREKRVSKLQIKPLSDREREEFVRDWEHQQALFVDDPRAAMKGADRLVAQVLKARGYPVGDFDQRAADISVDHPVVVENYRIAHTIAERDNADAVSTEQLREAMIHYRALFADLLHDGGMQPVRDLSNGNRARVKEAGR
ncbi:MAG: hypothetical protein ABR555_14300 [Pyrinomonadaceae bacterium]